MDFAQLFKTADKNASYTIVDSNHPLEFYVGRDEKGYKSFVFVTKSKIDEMTGTKSIDVKRVKTDKEYRLFITLLNDEMFDIYCHLLNDIVDSTYGVSNSDAGAKEVCKRYLKWRAFFHAKKNKTLSEEQTMGLIGELLFLKKLFIKIPKREAINCWSGCELTHKDFSIGNTWYEIKTPAFASDSIHISSLEQLDADIDGYLVAYNVEKMSQEFDGISLKKIFNELMAQLDNQNDKDALVEKIIEVGWNPELDKNIYVFRLVEKKAYLVNKDFPKITHSMVPSAITKVEYRVLKAEINQYEVDYEQL